MRFEEIRKYYFDKHFFLGVWAYNDKIATDKYHLYKNIFLTVFLGGFGGKLHWFHFLGMGGRMGDYCV